MNCPYRGFPPYNSSLRFSILQPEEILLDYLKIEVLSLRVKVNLPAAGRDVSFVNGLGLWYKYLWT
jgi:hypothetical protein